jgi:ribonucleoside-diphosphate reductase alpha chain
MVPENFTEVRPAVVDDSREGWADSVKHLVTGLYAGKDVSFDYDQVRRKGSRLKTMGGRASGPEPLMALHHFIKETFSQARGRRLTPLEVHDCLNKVAEVVVSGGVRRSSQVSLSDLNDEQMRDAKVWPFPGHRAMANNSAVFYERPSPTVLMREFASLVDAGTGERGIFNMGSVLKNSPTRRDATKIAGSNPCLEILLRSRQFCNLSEVVARPTDDISSMIEKFKIATWIGVIQSTFTYFPYLSPEWQKNCEEERLLGVSITGQMDAPQLFEPEALKAYKTQVLFTAKQASKMLGINNPTATTCTKPSGTCSLLVDSSSGVHPRYAQYYMRRFRISATDPLLRMMVDQGFEAVPEVGQDPETAATWVVEFPVKAPEGAITRNDLSALDQLKWYLKVVSNYCEHNVSATVYYSEDEVMGILNFVYKHWNKINGVSFLPRDGGKYELAPYEEITKEQYEEALARTPRLDYSQLSRYELENHTTEVGSYACTGDRCELT